jgi:uncharacterized C2H2 Zn-finger protein
MVIYTCHKCNKQFLNKTDFKRHINRKFTCNTNFNNKPDDIVEIAEIILNKFVCKDCNKIFSRKFTLERHINLNRCKNIKSNENINLNLKISELESKIEKLLNDRNINSNTNITNNNITNNNNNNNNITNNITNNIIIKFGYEHKSTGLTNKEIIRVINKGCSSLCESIKLTHFNSRLPELHNIYIPDRNFKNNSARRYALTHTRPLQPVSPMKTCSIILLKKINSPPPTIVPLKKSKKNPAHLPPTTPTTPALGL